MVKLIAEFSKAFCNAVQSEREKLGSIDAVFNKGEQNCAMANRLISNVAFGQVQRLQKKKKTAKNCLKP